ncbi:MAG: hypothetical protein ACFB4J_00920 [Elainellaceae cyanobacterium]
MPDLVVLLCLAAPRQTMALQQKAHSISTLRFQTGLGCDRSTAEPLQQTIGSTAAVTLDVLISVPWRWRNPEERTLRNLMGETTAEADTP